MVNLIEQNCKIELLENINESFRETEATPTPEESKETLPPVKICLSPKEGDLMVLDRYKGHLKKMPLQYVGESLGEGEEKELKITIESPTDKEKICKPELLTLAEHPQIKVKVYQQKPFVSELIDIVKTHVPDIIEPPTDIRYSTWYGEIDYIPELEAELEEAHRFFTDKSSKSKDFEIKPIRKIMGSKPLIGKHSKGWYKPDQHFWRTLEKIKIESRQKLEEQFHFIKPKIEVDTGEDQMRPSMITTYDTYYPGEGEFEGEGGTQLYDPFAEILPNTPA